MIIEIKETPIGDENYTPAIGVKFFGNYIEIKKTPIGDENSHLRPEVSPFPIEIKKTPIGDENQTIEVFTAPRKTIEIKKTPIGDENTALSPKWGFKHY